jgi:amino acid permease
MLIAAMIPLTLGVAGDFFVVVRKITKSDTSGIVIALVSLLFFYGLWFGFTIYRRNQKRSGPQAAEHNKRQFAS